MIQSNQATVIIGMRNMFVPYQLMDNFRHLNNTKIIIILNLNYISSGMLISLIIEFKLP